MRVFGLTGSIAMGKTTAARMLKILGLPVHDADACVHRMFVPGGAAVAPIARAFPDAVAGNAVDRDRLGRQVFANPPALAALEKIVHPLVRKDRDRFLARHRRRRCARVVLDVPLLFESGGRSVCDAVIVVSAPAFLQRHRALGRTGMTEEKLAAILARQMPDRDKRQRADIVIPTGLGRAWTYRALRRYMIRQRRRAS